MVDMDALGTYLFDRDVSPVSTLVWVGMALSAVSLLVGLLVPYLAWLTARRKKKILPYISVIRPFAAMMRTIGLIALLLFFLRYEAIYPFMLRIWLVIVAVVATVWAAVIVRRYRALKPVVAKALEIEDRFEKYLPRPKRKA